MAASKNRNNARAKAQPGEMLEALRTRHQLSVTAVADLCGVHRQRIHEVIAGTRPVSTDLALRFAKLFGNDVSVWLDAQRELDIRDTTKEIRGELGPMAPFLPSGPYL